MDDVAIYKLINSISKCAVCNHGKWAHEKLCRNEHCPTRKTITVRHQPVYEVRRTRSVDKRQLIERIFQYIKHDFTDHSKAKKVAELIADGYSGRYMKGTGLWGYKKTVDVIKHFGLN